MSIHVCKSIHKGEEEWHLRYPGMTQDAAQELADKINGGELGPAATAIAPLAADPKNQHAINVPGFGWVAVAAVRAIERAHGIG